MKSSTSRSRLSQFSVATLTVLFVSFAFFFVLFTPAQEASAQLITAPPTTTMPSTTTPLQPRCDIRISTPGGGPVVSPATAAPALTAGQYLDVENMKQVLAQVMWCRAERVNITDITYDSFHGFTQFTARFLAPLETSTPSPNSFFFTPAPTTSTTAAPGNGTTTTGPTPPPTTPTTTSTTYPSWDATAIELGQLFRRRLINEGIAIIAPYTPQQFFFQDVPAETEAPPTQEVYTPVPTFDEEGAVVNGTGFGSAIEENSEIVAIVLSVIIGSILVVAVTLIIKNYYDKKALEEKPDMRKGKYMTRESTV